MPRQRPPGRSQPNFEGLLVVVVDRQVLGEAELEARRRWRSSRMAEPESYRLWAFEAVTSRPAIWMLPPLVLRRPERASMSSALAVPIDTGDGDDLPRPHVE